MGILDGLLTAVTSGLYGAGATANQLLDEKRRLALQQKQRQQQLEAEKELRKFLTDLQIQKQLELEKQRQQQKLGLYDLLFGKEGYKLGLQQPPQQEGFGINTAIQNTLPVPKIEETIYGGMLPEKYKTNEDVRASALAQLLGVNLPQPQQPKQRGLIKGDLGDRLAMIDPITGEVVNTIPKTQQRKQGSRLMKVKTGNKVLLVDPFTGEPVKEYKIEGGKKKETKSEFFNYLKLLSSIKQRKAQLMAKPLDVMGDITGEQSKRLEEAIQELETQERNLKSLLYSKYPEEMNEYEKRIKEPLIQQIKKYLGEQ